ncbi:hypothetical protein QF037_006396 [Streptomyces canus]|nr:hypothetical protein [Streptomyces canus]
MCTAQLAGDGRSSGPWWGSSRAFGFTPSAAARAVRSSMSIRRTFFGGSAPASRHGRDSNCSYARGPLAHTAGGPLAFCARQAAPELRGWTVDVAGSHFGRASNLEGRKKAPAGARALTFPLVTGVCPRSEEWGGWDSNPRPTDYESIQDLGGPYHFTSIHGVLAGQASASLSALHGPCRLVPVLVVPMWSLCGPCGSSEMPVRHGILRAGQASQSSLPVLSLGRKVWRAQRPSITVPPTNSDTGS